MKQLSNYLDVGSNNILSKPNQELNAFSEDCISLTENSFSFFFKSLEFSVGESRTSSRYFDSVVFLNSL